MLVGEQRDETGKGRKPGMGGYKASCIVGSWSLIHQETLGTSIKAQNTASELTNPEVNHWLKAVVCVGWVLIPWHFQPSWGFGWKWGEGGLKEKRILAPWLPKECSKVLRERKANVGRQLEAERALGNDKVPGTWGGPEGIYSIVIPKLYYLCLRLQVSLTR